MKKQIYIYLFVISLTNIYAQHASQEIYNKIINIEVSLKEKKPLNQKDLKEIVCLSNIETKNGDGNYLGISFFPTENEVLIWKEWFEKNKNNISYSTESELYNKEFKTKVIKVEFENGKFRNNVCDEDKNYLIWVTESVKQTKKEKD
jgi:hypothetical protein